MAWCGGRVCYGFLRGSVPPLRARFGFGWVFLGVLPVLLYGVFYLSRVLLLPEGKRMEDFYGFNKTGKWYLSVIFMLLGAFALSVLLWLI